MKRGSGRNRIFTTTGGGRFPNVYPKTALPFLLTVLPIEIKKGAAADPLNCRVEIPIIQFNRENSRLIPYFLSAWTPFSCVKKLSSFFFQKEHFTGLFEIRSCLYPHYNYQSPAPTLVHGCTATLDTTTAGPGDKITQTPSPPPSIASSSSLSMPVSLPLFHSNQHASE